MSENLLTLVAHNFFLISFGLSFVCKYSAILQKKNLKTSKDILKKSEINIQNVKKLSKHKNRWILAM
jgi:hypothetical protein